MTYGNKTLYIALALVLALLSIGGSYWLGLAQARADDSPRIVAEAVPPAPPRKPGAGLSSQASTVFSVREILDAVATRLKYRVDRGTYSSSQPLGRELSSFRPEDVPEALALLPLYREAADDARFEAVAGIVFTYWALEDLDAAREGLTAEEFLRSDGKVSAHALRVVMEIWARTEPVAALRRVLDLQDAGLTPFDPQLGAGTEGDLFPHWFTSDPTAAWEDMNRRIATQPRLMCKVVGSLIHAESSRHAFAARLSPGTSVEVRQEAFRLLQNYLRWIQGDVFSSGGSIPPQVSQQFRKERAESVCDRLGLDHATREEVMKSL